MLSFCRERNRGMRKCGDKGLFSASVSVLEFEGKGYTMRYQQVCHYEIACAAGRPDPFLIPNAVSSLSAYLISLYNQELKPPRLFGLKIALYLGVEVFRLDSLNWRKVLNVAKSPNHTHLPHPHRQQHTQTHTLFKYPL